MISTYVVIIIAACAATPATKPAGSSASAMKTDTFEAILEKAVDKALTESERKGLLQELRAAQSEDVSDDLERELKAIAVDASEDYAAKQKEIREEIHEHVGNKSGTRKSRDAEEKRLIEKRIANQRTMTRTTAAVVNARNFAQKLNQAANGFATSATYAKYSQDKKSVTEYRIAVRSLATGIPSLSQAKAADAVIEVSLEEHLAMLVGKCLQKHEAVLAQLAATNLPLLAAILATHDKVFWTLDAAVRPWFSEIRRSQSTLFANQSDANPHRSMIATAWAKALKADTIPPEAMNYSSRWIDPAALDEQATLQQQPNSNAAPPLRSK